MRIEIARLNDHNKILQYFLIIAGDVGYMDDNDNLFVMDRVKELIKYKAFQVNTRLSR